MKKLNFKSGFMIISIIILVVFVGTLLFPKSDGGLTEDEFLEKYDLNNLTIKEMVSRLDKVTNEKEGFNAGVTSSELILSDENHKFTFDIPNDEFYLSFAPYVNSTHPCANHSLVTCRGELAGQTIDVLIEDSSGNVLIDDEYKAMENGFIGIWLQKDKDITITVSYDGKTAVNRVSTFEGDDTCLTTLRLT